MASALQPGTLVGRYRLVKRIARGGMGSVWVARDIRLERDVAVKVLPRMLVRDSAAQVRFEREARAMARLSHANVVSVLDVGSADPGTGEELPFLVMELLRGRSLDLELMEGPVYPYRAVTLILQVARALGAAHAAGVIHRDLKPSNIMIGAQDHIKVLDFGLARLGEREGGSPEESLTTPGMVLGSCPYMAPEQALGHEVSPASDIFSCGSVLYEALAGTRAFEGETPMHVLQAVVKVEYKPLEQVRPETPPSVLAVVERCLSQDPRKRYADGDELADDLGRLAAEISASESATLALIQSQGPVEAARKKRRRQVVRWLAVSLALLATGVISGLFVGRSKMEPLRPDPGAWSVRELMRVKGDLRHPSWDSSGSRLVAEWSLRGRTQILVVSKDSGEWRVLFEGRPGENLTWPSFSPDDRSVAVSVAVGETHTLRVIRASGGSTVQEISSARHGTWLDSQRLAYSRIEDAGSCLWIYDLESKTESKALGPQEGRGWWALEPRPGGGFVVLSGRADMRSGLYVGRRLGPPFDEWLAPGQRVTGFSWAPNGRSLIATVNGALTQLSPAGSRQLMPAMQRLRNPAFSPDGSSLAVMWQSLAADRVATGSDGEWALLLFEGIDSTRW